MVSVEFGDRGVELTSNVTTGMCQMCLGVGYAGVPGPRHMSALCSPGGWLSMQASRAATILTDCKSKVKV